MATLSAGQEGMASADTNDTTASARACCFPFNPSQYNQTYITLYKMMGKCSLEASGWDFWENTTGDEVGRTVHGVQEAGTIVAVRISPEGF